VAVGFVSVVGWRLAVCGWLLQGQKCCWFHVLYQLNDARERRVQYTGINNKQTSTEASPLLPRNITNLAEQPPHPLDRVKVVVEFIGDVVGGRGEALLLWMVV
jgi:hypothetical protein